MPLFNEAGKRWLQSVTNAQTATAVQTAVGTVTASELVSADANKDTSQFRNLGATTHNAGLSGAAGTVNIFPATASKGKVAITKTDNSADDTTSLVVGAMAAARTLTVADPLASCNFLMGRQAALAITANADGLTTAIIPDFGGFQYVVVTSANSAHIVTLPTPTPGTMVIIDCITNGCKVRSSTPASIAINGGTGASAVSTLAAGETAWLVCTTATAWKGYKMDADSDLAKFPAAA